MNDVLERAYISDDLREAKLLCSAMYAGLCRYSTL
jgi:hypothetical protein